MREVCACLVVLTAVLGTSVPSAVAQAAPKTPAPSLPVGQAANDDGSTPQKLALAQQIIRAREQARQRGAFDAPTVRYWTGRLSRLSVSQLLEISAAGPNANLNQLLLGMGAGALSDNVSPDLGDTSADLVYTKLAPCRVADTRVAGGALAAASQRNFHVAGAGDYAGQGGVACGVPFGATSVAFNITVVPPNAAGWLRAWPYGGSGTASIINWASGNTLANGLIMPICDPATASCPLDLTLRADAGGTHVLIDVMGYFQKVDKADYRTFNVAHSSTLPTVPIADTGCTNHIFITITAPSAGRVTVTSRTQLGIVHSQGTASEFQFGISTTAASCSWSSGAEAPFVGLPSTMPSGLYGPADTAIAAFDVLAGTHTYYLNARRISGSASFYWTNMTATFNPS